MSLRVLYLPGAEFDLEAIYDLIAQDSPRAAYAFVEDVRRRCESLGDFPFMGRPLDPQFRHLTLDRRIRVIYSVTETEVHLLQFRYLGQQ